MALLLQAAEAGGRLEWRRVSELCARPRLAAPRGGGHCAVTRGSLGSSWFVAAASVLAGAGEAWRRVVCGARDLDWEQYR